MSKPPKPGVIPPPEKVRDEVERFLSGTSYSEADKAIKGKRATIKVDSQGKVQYSAPLDDGPLVVLVDSPRGVIVPCKRQHSAKYFVFGKKPNGEDTKALEEPQMSSNAMLAPIASAVMTQGAGAALGAIAGGMLGALLASPRRPMNTRRTGAALVTPPVVATTTILSAFLLSADLVGQTGVVAGDKPAWAYCLATLTDAWVDPYVVQAAMVRDQALFDLLERTGEGMREASAKGGTFDLQRVATDVRAMLAPGR